MPIGKDSITKRVAKVETPAVEIKEEKTAPELVATTAAAPKKAPAKKTSTTSKSTTAKKSASSTAKTTPTKKTTTTKKTTPAKAPEVATNVLANVAPETVEAVVGHKENQNFEKVQIGGNLPTHLL